MTDFFSFLQTQGRCPDCSGAPLEIAAQFVICPVCGAQFPIVEGKPVLMSHQNRVFPIEAYSAENLKKHAQIGGFLRRIADRLPSSSVNLNRPANLRAFAQNLPKNQVTILVLGSGRQRAEMEAWRTRYSNIHLIYGDVDAGAKVDAFCDAHQLPFQENSFDGLITTAVMEHVLDPEKAAQEVARVVKIGGILYSEIPFMQQVHEGAYDFTRYTLSGHRRLFRDFRELKSGAVAGPGTALVWAIEYFFMSFGNSPKSRMALRLMARILFFWLKNFDRALANRSAGLDGASCTFFLGKRAEEPTSDEAIIEGYRGAKVWSHL